MLIKVAIRPTEYQPTYNVWVNPALIMSIEAYVPFKGEEIEWYSIIFGNGESALNYSITPDEMARIADKLIDEIDTEDNPFSSIIKERDELKLRVAALQSELDAANKEISLPTDVISAFRFSNENGVLPYGERDKRRFDLLFVIEKYIPEETQS